MTDSGNVEKLLKVSLERLSMGKREAHVISLGSLGCKTLFDLIFFLFFSWNPVINRLSLCRNPKMDDCCLYIWSHFQCKMYAFCVFSLIFVLFKPDHQWLLTLECLDLRSCSLPPGNTLWESLKIHSYEICGNQLRKLMLGMLQLQANFIWSFHAFRHTGISTKHKPMENNLSLVKAYRFCTGQEGASQTHEYHVMHGFHSWFSVDN